MTDRNEALRLADELAGNQLYGLQRRCRDEAAALLRQQSERIAELEAEVLEQARCTGMGAERELALMAERDRLQAEVERTSNNRDMWKGQCERQAEQLAQMRAEVERLSEFFDADMAVSKIFDEVSPGLTSPPGTEWSDRADAAVARRCAAVIAIDLARTTHKETE